LYWFLSGSPISIVPFLLVALAWMVGGWLVARTAFRLEPRERLTVGVGLGLAAFVFLSNVLARWLAADIAFAGAAVLVLAAGLLASRGNPVPLREDLVGWPVLAGVLVATIFFTLIGRGLAILDDRKNLSLISMMAAGDIPPHFYMNPVALFRYHYGFQLLGASAVRLGGLFPWSAFDLSKGFVAALSLGAAYLVGRRLGKRSSAGWLTAACLLFGGGARWVLLVLPPTFLAEASKHVVLWGSAASSADSLRLAMLGPWLVGGGPPTPIPFAYLSGILEPFVLGMQAGPGSLSRLFLCVAILALPRLKGVVGVASSTVLFCAWALGFDAIFGLFAIGLVVWAVALRFWSGEGGWRRTLRGALAAVILAGILSLVQGGTLTEIARATLAPSGNTGVAGGEPAFFLRWPPAIVSSHFGELRFTDPWALAVGAIELGAPLAAALFVVPRAFHWGRRRRFEMGTLAVASLAGFLIPMVAGYSPDRDVSRLTAFSLQVWILLSIPLLFQAWRHWPGWPVRAVTVVYLVVLMFSGVATLASLLTAAPRVVFTEDVAPLDAGMASVMWNRLPPDAVVFDSHPWRAVVLTGRATRSSDLEYKSLPEWSALVADPSPGGMARGGYTHVYADEIWWRGLTQSARTSFEVPCVQTLWEGEDDADNGWRRMLDISSCSSSP
jgi:hypothetical protein